MNLDSSVDQLLIPELSTRPLTVVARFAGAFGRVLIVEAHDQKRYALKSLKSPELPDWESLRTEATLLVDIPRHTNVLPIDGIIWNDSVPWLVMPAMKSNLRDTFRGYDRRWAFALVNDVASGLAHIHRLGLIHRDLKPENILVTEAGSFVISDFGLSAFAPRPDNLRDATNERGVIAGTVAYMSPEHFSTGELTPKADIFALGIVLYECLTGRHPFLGGSIEDIANRILYHSPEFTETERLDLPKVLVDLCLACLKKNPKQRPGATDIGSAFRAEPATLQGAGGSHPADAVNRAQTLLQLGRRSEGRQLLTETLEANPWFLPAALTLAEFEFEEGNVKQAVECARLALSVAQWTLPRPPGVQTLLTNLAAYYMPLDPHLSISFSRQAVKLDREDWQALGNLAEACRVLGEARARQDFLDEGDRAVKEALQRAPHDLKLLVTRGGLLLAKGAIDQATSFVVDLVNEHGGDDVHLRYLLIRVLIASDRFEEAERWLAPMRQYPELHPIVRVAEGDIVSRKRQLGAK